MRLLEEKKHLESELQESVSTVSNLNLQSKEAVDTIVMLNNEITQLDEEANKLSEERDKALRTTTVTQRQLADLSRRSVRTMQHART
ncbi:hypothetical protein SERLA73DRAFT_141731 [Serpula lacrymans var. lacrymans S7.3]|uniref:Uncharacterized protein n=2 Tax=Serpula lacrymans var. lacrymans TaxID=341189 RepID=F8Q6W4_SERL3|nr:uncharacterized protein SERLADRAFT_397443 [Serpula lacrymans var. lacrymans S7.9]EGN96352.1 hypothetical protein SERLA73DRAFT_141731 [Serpula lacrymans var. lacrymans S7.3]EGO21891.1 hypothetical protein SERLADRAFT_397443 [Serpula lacrymans var. lacrymans S7.9]